MSGERDDSPEQEQIRELLRGLPSDAPDAGFVDRVMRELPDRRDSWGSRALTWLLGTRELRLRWNLAAALALAVVVGAGVATLMRREASAPAPNEASVVLVFAAPSASSVTVAGDFNQWQPGATPMRDEDGDGVWSIQIGLSPGRYEYMFVVDGKEWLTDPLARAHRPDGFGRQNAVLDL